MPAWFYPAALAALSVLVLVLEVFFPARPDQRLWRGWGSLSDLSYLVFNGHFLGAILWGVSTRWVMPYVEIQGDLATHWPLWVQIPVALIAIDLMQWGVHFTLHKVPFLWRLHEVHHSVVDGEMSWIVAFRFHWAESVVYKSLLYVPLALLGFGDVAVMTHAIVGTLIGHLNHANLSWDWGPLRYVVNSPRMHLWHHDAEVDGRGAVNYGIIFSAWDWLFGTAKLPNDPPSAIGFEGVEKMPGDFFSQTLWPLSLKWRPLAMLLGAALIGVGWFFH